MRAIKRTHNERNIGSNFARQIIVVSNVFKDIKMPFEQTACIASFGSRMSLFWCSSMAPGVKMKAYMAYRCTGFENSMAGGGK
jgi:hypothetical protein